MTNTFAEIDAAGSRQLHALVKRNRRTSALSRFNCRVAVALLKTSPPAPLLQGEGRRLLLPLGEGWGEGKMGSY